MKSRHRDTDTETEEGKARQSGRAGKMLQAEKVGRQGGRIGEESGAEQSRASLPLSQKERTNKKGRGWW